MTYVRSNIVTFSIFDQANQECHFSSQKNTCDRKNACVKRRIHFSLPVWKTAFMASQTLRFHIIVYLLLRYVHIIRQKEIACMAVPRGLLQFRLKNGKNYGQKQWNLCSVLITKGYKSHIVFKAFKNTSLTTLDHVMIIIMKVKVHPLEMWNENFGDCSFSSFYLKSAPWMEKPVDSWQPMHTE